MLFKRLFSFICKPKVLKCNPQNGNKTNGEFDKYKFCVVSDYYGTKGALRLSIEYKDGGEYTRDFRIDGKTIFTTSEFAIDEKEVADFSVVVYNKMHDEAESILIWVMKNGIIIQKVSVNGQAMIGVINPEFGSSKVPKLKQ